MSLIVTVLDVHLLAHVLFQDCLQIITVSER
jgi:hypothetical protein